MKSHRMAAAVLALAAAVAAAAPESTEVFQAPVGSASANTPRVLIETAHARGLLSHEERILLLALSLYQPERLPAAYRGDAPEKCGTRVAREIERALPDLPENIAHEIRSMRSRPSCDTYYDTAHFRIHFNTSGDDMILGWPDTAYRDSIAVAVERAWSQEVTSLGFRAPPNDGNDPDGGGGNSLYDVYLQNCSGYYGYCEGSYTVPSTPRTDCTSFIVIDNDYAGFGYPDPTDPMKVTVAHEFCHACQFSSNYDVDTWYMECTSVWAEDMVYDDINDYRGYLSYYLNYPYHSLEWQDITGLRMYGSCVWNFFLTEHVAGDIVPGIWARLESTTDAYAAFDYCLGLEGTTLEETYKTYAVWNWFTDTRDDGLHYDEGAYWPLVAAQRTYTSYPVIGGGPPPLRRPDHMAWNYIHLDNPGGPEDILDVSYDGPSPSTIESYVCLNATAAGGNTSEQGELTIDAEGNGSTTVHGWDGMERVAVVVVNASTTEDNMDYSIDVDRSTPVDDSFYADALDSRQVTLRWTLASPELVESLDVLRRTAADAEYSRLNDHPLAPDSPGSFVDTDVYPGEELWYELVAILRDGREEIVGGGPVSVRVQGTLGLALLPPRPNPFAGSTSLEFTLPSPGAFARVAVYDVAGRLAKVLFDGPLGAGRHECVWDGTDARGRPVAAGVYFVTLEVPGGLVSQKVMVLH